jgi:hypothetical protein
LFYILHLLSSPKIFVLTWDSLASLSPKFRRKARERERERESSNALLLVRYKVSIQHEIEGVRSWNRFMADVQFPVGQQHFRLLTPRLMSELSANLIHKSFPQFIGTLFSVHDTFILVI